ncbi:hypothetical protein H6P81_002340 [Aristolochia fimbriata]|uniref:Protein TAPETUM DETERMINANT 1-like n=1 Tax=Aristolochia fimbriata TaxID=158543 RepID=A0AAV7FDK9_ARIFI|nr:hypothetical protein H6P81_002340 [Aristolochia fimbriata]
MRISQASKLRKVSELGVLLSKHIMSTGLHLFAANLMVIISICNAGFFLPGASNRLETHVQDDTTPAVPALNTKLTAQGVCSNRDIVISQSRSSTTGIPEFIVQIVNTCMSACAPSNIHLHCGWFASARMVNPRTFKRLSFDDCLVNAGKPLKSSEMLRFTYSNSFMYPLAFKSASFCS